MSQFTRTRPAASSTILRRRDLLGGVIATPVAALPWLGIDAGAQPRGLTRVDLGGASVVQGAGCNVVAIAGETGALIVDGGLEPQSDALLAYVFELTGNDRIELLVNTHWHPAQTGSNVAVGRAGGAIFAHEKTAMYLSNAIHLSVELDAPREALPEIGRPTSVTRGDGMLEFAGSMIDYGYLPAAHTDGDLYLHFADRDLLVAGGVVARDHWPLIDYLAGAWYGGRVRALQWLAELVDDETRVVPAHGPLMTGRDVVRQRDICLELFETFIAYMNRGFGPEDAVANNPLAAYEEEFGDPSAFLDGAYRSMLIAYVPD